VTTPELPALLVERREDLLRFVDRHAAGLARFETAEDLVQGIHARALDRGADFEYRSEKEFLGWLHQLARTYLADRRAHWAALKRGSGRLLRLTDGAPSTTDPHAAAAPVSTRTGPSTFASRREELALAVKALALLLPRDRDLVKWRTESVPLEEQAARLGVTYDAAERAALRAVERFKKAYRVVSRGPVRGK
jgi:RNA polymerase sigma factor (sigma-70 family)